MGLEGGDGEVVVDGLFIVILEGERGFRGELAAIVDKAEERLDGVVEVVAVVVAIGVVAALPAARAAPLATPTVAVCSTVL